MTTPKPTHFTVATTFGNPTVWTVDQTFPTKRLAEGRPRKHEAELLERGAGMSSYAVIPSDGTQEAIEAGIARLNADESQCYTLIKEFDMGYMAHYDFKVFVIEPWRLSMLTCDRGRSGGRNDNSKRLRVECDGKFAFYLNATLTLYDVRDVIDVYKNAHKAGWDSGYAYAWDYIKEKNLRLVDRNAAA